MFNCRTAGICSSSFHALCANLTSMRGLDGINCRLVDLSTFEPLELRMGDTRVLKLYEPSPTPILYVEPAQNMVGRVLIMHLFLDGNPTPTILMAM